MAIIKTEEFNNKSLDVMQHVRRIYELLGANSDGTIPDTAPKDDIYHVLEVIQKSEKIFVGTNAEYDEAFGAGELVDTICFITDDFVA